MTAGVRLDLHVHSRHSPDSRLRVEEIVRRLAYTGLRGFALTDHNSVAGHRELRELAAAAPAYLFLPGVEVSTSEGHLLAYGVSEAPPPRRTLEATADWVRDHGGEPVLAHPFRWRHGAGGRWAATAHVAGLETRNAHNGEAANLRAELWAARRNLGSTGGSDVHTLPDLGRAFTLFPEEARTVDDLLEAIRRRETTAGGRSLSGGGRVRLALAQGVRFVGRGLRPV